MFSCALVCMFLCTVFLASAAGGLPYTWVRTKDDLNHACMRETIPGFMMSKRGRSRAAPPFWRALHGEILRGTRLRRHISGRDTHDELYAYCSRWVARAGQQAL